MEVEGKEEGSGSLFCRMDSHSHSVMNDDQVLIAVYPFLRYLRSSLKFISVLQDHIIVKAVRQIFSHFT